MIIGAQSHGLLEHGHSVGAVSKIEIRRAQIGVEALRRCNLQRLSIGDDCIIPLPGLKISRSEIVVPQSRVRRQLHHPPEGIDCFFVLADLEVDRAQSVRVDPVVGVNIDGPLVSLDGVVLLRRS